MKNGVIAGVLICALTACSGNGSGSAGSAGSASSASSLNPFGKAKARKAALEAPIEYRDPRAFIPEIKSLRGEPAKGGILIRATGHLDKAGYYGVTLVPLNDGAPNDEGDLVFEFRAYLPEQTSSLRQEDTVEAAVFVSSKRLKSVRRIQVQAQSNSMSIRR
jgi:hypothetical protein